MSLDVYLSAPKPTEGGSGIFVRENGRTKELTREEWDVKFPGQEPYVAPICEGFSANITHNLGKMALEAGLYLALWRPGQLKDPEKSALVEAQSKVGNYHDAGGVYEIEKTLPTVYAEDLIPALEAGLALLKSDPARFKKFNPENGWGDYDGLVEFTEEYLLACQNTPFAEVGVWR